MQIHKNPTVVPSKSVLGEYVYILGILLIVGGIVFGVSKLPGATNGGIFPELLIAGPITLLGLIVSTYVLAVITLIGTGFLLKRQQTKKALFWIIVFLYLCSAGILTYGGYITAVNLKF